MKKIKLQTLAILNLILVIGMTPVPSSAVWFGGDSVDGAANFSWTYIDNTYEEKFWMTDKGDYFEVMAASLYYKNDWNMIGWAYWPTADFKPGTPSAGLCASGSWATNYKDPAHDYDDDNNDGCKENVEVTATSWESFLEHRVKTNKAYYFRDSFYKSIGSQANSMYFNHEISGWGYDFDSENWEYLALGYDLIDHDPYSFNLLPPGGGGGGGSCTNFCPQSGDLVTTVSTSFSNSMLTVDINPTKLHAENLNLESLKLGDTADNSPQISKIQINDFGKSATELEQEVNDAYTTSLPLFDVLSLDFVYTTITFDEPVKLAGLQKFVKENNIVLHQYEGYAVDSDGDTIVFGGIPNNPLILKRNDYKNSLPTGINEEGIYAIWGMVPVSFISNIKSSPKVLTLDLRAFIQHFYGWLNNEIGTVLAINYEVNDLYWKLS